MHLVTLSIIDMDCGQPSFVHHSIHKCFSVWAGYSFVSVTLAWESRCSVIIISCMSHPVTAAWWIASETVQVGDTGGLMSKEAWWASHWRPLLFSGWSAFSCALSSSIFVGALGWGGFGLKTVGGLQLLWCTRCPERQDLCSAECSY